MKLKRAITRASGFLSPGGLLHFEHCGEKGRIVALGQRFTVIIQLDAPCPTLSCDAKELSKMLRTIPGDVSGKIVEQAFRIGNEEGALDVPLQSIPKPIQTPPLPEANFTLLEKWPTVQQVFHAAATEKHVSREMLQYVWFGPEATAATDEGSVAYAHVGLGEGQLIHATAFAKWPKGDVYGFLDHTYGWFRVGDETRIVPVLQAWYPPLEPILLPKDRFQFAVRFDRGLLLKSINAATSLSNMKQIRVYGSGKPPGYTIVPVYPKQMGTLFAKPLEGSDDAHLDVFLDGKKVVALLKSYVSEEVEIRFTSDPKLPLRFCAPDFVEDVYPMLEVA